MRRAISLPLWQLLAPDHRIIALAPTGICRARRSTLDTFKLLCPLLNHLYDAGTEHGCAVRGKVKLPHCHFDPSYALAKLELRKVLNEKLEDGPRAFRP